MKNEIALDEVKAPSKVGGLAIVGLCFLYIISPIDLMPEIILGPFGLVDDFGALFLAIKTIKQTFFETKA
jgi:uncharacterized membrane protein YkvA (DUF1232 family)